MQSPRAIIGRQPKILGYTKLNNACQGFDTYTRRPLTDGERAFETVFGAVEVFDAATTVFAAAKVPGVRGFSEAV
jgi:hypothetical protein